MTTPSTVGKLERVDSVTGQAVAAAESFGGIWESVLEKLTIFTEITDVLSGFHPYAQTACSVLSAVPKALIAQKNRDDSVYCLMKAIDDMYSFVEYAQPLEEIKSHRKMLEGMSRLTMESSYLIRDYTIDKNFWKRFAKLTLSDVDAKIQQFNVQFEQAKTDFARHMDVTIYRCLKDVESHITQHIVLDGMLYAAGAGYDPDKSCIPGTRLAILTDLHDWINKPDVAADGSDTPRILVLAGVAGCGKSAIAHTIAQDYEDLKRLGSCFCFSQADRQARGPGNILSTIAKDIADLDPQWKLSLYNAVKNNESLRKSTSLARQMNHLILEPAKDAPITGPTVIVIDALDESGDTPDRLSLLQVLSKSASELPGNFRILITTRPEDDIIRAFKDRSYIKLRYADAMDEAAIADDIAELIKRKLVDITHILEGRWPNGLWIILLVKASGHLFQWAATACRAILDGPHGYDPTERLNKFVQDASGLDNLYIEILRHAFDQNDEEVIARFKRVLGSILTAKEPLCTPAHSALQHVIEGKDDVQNIVGHLGSLLHGATQLTTPVCALHASFFDFLKDKQRSKAFFVDPTQLEHRFVLACLRVMKDELRFNICHLSTSHVHNADVPDMQDLVGRFISPHLLYACRFLGTHLEATPYYETRVSDELRVFLHENFLFWLEVLSLTKEMNAATRTLASIDTWSQKYPSDLTAFVRDAIRFVNVFMPPISQSAPHIYLSALPFAPSESLVSQTYLLRYPFTMRLKGGKLNRWPAELKTFEGHRSGVYSIAYSPDGTRIVLGSVDSTVCVWDAETGTVIVGPLRVGHGGVVNCVAYSPDGKHIISASEDGTIQVWDAETGEMLGSPFEGHNEPIYSITYSPDGKHIVWGSGDKIIRAWDKEIGEAVGSPFQGHTDCVLSVACSPDGKCIASGSGDCTIRMWDAKTGQAVGSPFEGHSDSVWSVAYSPDGKRLASGSDDHTVRVWDAETGKTVGSPLEGHSRGVRSVVYSPDGGHIVSGSRDMVIRMWDAETGVAFRAPFTVHLDMVTSVAFAPDGKHIVSGSLDNTIRVWEVNSVKCTSERYTLCSCSDICTLLNCLQRHRV
ncbi:WD40 repeat-like protein [Athelia psychrophila]|uniref:WD40 repeat-like protein n=1 Tax=Athelia psychrophila TaxID=1759441 RepID=A0A166G419_9AGAM|nr:WD40 repeat-like protein [Fibularhizoctonia sp. CBS 109695]